MYKIKIRLDDDNIYNKEKIKYIGIRLHDVINIDNYFYTNNYLVNLVIDEILLLDDIINNSFIYTNNKKCYYSLLILSNYYNVNYNFITQYSSNMYISIEIR